MSRSAAPLHPARALSVVLLLAGLAWSQPLAASPAEAVVDQSAKVFKEGTFEGAVLDPDGLIRPGPAVDRYPVEDAEALTVVAYRRDGVVAVGTAKKGRVLRYNGKAFREVFAGDSEEDQRVTALAFVGDDEIWAGLAPSGRLVRILKNRKVEEVETFESAYVWRILPIGKGDVLVATGVPGMVIRFSRNGKIRESKKIGAEHAMDLLQDGGDIWVGTALPGRVLRLDRFKRLRVLFEVGETGEVKRVLRSGSSVLALSNASSSASGSKEKKDKKNSKPPESGDAFGLTRKPPEPGPMPKGAGLWRVQGDGSAMLMADLGKPVVHDAALLDDGGALVAASDGGTIFRVGAGGRVSLYADLPDKSVEALVTDPKGQGWATTSATASLVKLGRAALKPLHTSRVIDLGLPSHIGRVDYVGEGASLEVRTGATEPPSDEGWSPFVKVPSGGGAPKVPPGRYVQYRVSLSGAAAHLRAVRLGFRTPNLPPVVTGVLVVDRKVKAPPPKKKPATKGLRKASKVVGSVKAKTYTGIKRIAFDVLDPDGDDLRFHVSVRRIGAAHPVRLTREEGTGDGFVDWPVGDYPDGRYEILVKASDAAANPPGEGLSAEAVGGPVLVDNQAPSISVSASRAGKVVFEVEDGSSPLALVHVAIDAGPWQIVVPRDGVLDGKEETFDLELDALGHKGAGLLRIQAEDAFGHVAVRGVELK